MPHSFQYHFESEQFFSGQPVYYSNMWLTTDGSDRRQYKGTTALCIWQMVSCASQRVSKRRFHVISFCWKFSIVMDTVMFLAWLRTGSVPIYLLCRAVLSHGHCHKTCCSSMQVISFIQLITIYTIMLNISTRSHLHARLIETLHSNPCTVPLTSLTKYYFTKTQEIHLYIYEFKENLSGSFPWDLPVVKNSPEQIKSSGRIATFSLWTGMFRDGISSIPGETAIPLWLGRHFLVCENRVYHEKVRMTVG